MYRTKEPSGIYMVMDFTKVEYYLIKAILSVMVHTAPPVEKSIITGFLEKTGRKEAIIKNYVKQR